MAEAEEEEAGAGGAEAGGETVLAMDIPTTRGGIEVPLNQTLFL